MIDLDKAKKEFEKYVKPYDIQNAKISRKIAHSYRVVEVSEQIAKSLNLTEEDIELAKLIGLLHDIGRFEQIRIYDTFSDKDSIDHANLGVKILFEDGLIRNFIEENKYDEIIYKARTEIGRSDKILETVKAHKLVNRYDIKNEADKYVSSLAFVFDFYFKKGLEIVKERQYITKLINRVKTKDNEAEMNLIEENIQEYFKERNV